MCRFSSFLHGDEKRLINGKCYLMACIIRGVLANMMGYIVGYTLQTKSGLLEGEWACNIFSKMQLTFELPGTICDRKMEEFHLNQKIFICKQDAQISCSFSMYFIMYIAHILV